MFRKIGWIFVLFCSITFSLWGKHPVVFLHGWNSDDTIWKNLRMLLVQNSGYQKADLTAYSYYGKKGMGYTTSTPIEDIAAGIAGEVTEIYYAHGETPVDLVGHSMGGLVVRAMLAYDLIDQKCIGRFIPIATPNAGQNIDNLGGYEASQMKYGSAFLWKLTYDWHFDHRRIPEVLCIEGIGGSTDESPWDGLVHHWSAALESTPRCYVQRVHSSAQANGIYQGITGLKGDVIYGCPDGVTDPVYRSVSAFLSDGTVLAQSALNYTPPQEVYNHGGLFYQIIETNGTPVAYSKKEKALVNTFHFIGDNERDIFPDYLEHGKGRDESQQYGLELVYGTMPAGTYQLEVKAANSSSSPFSVDNVKVNPGTVSIYQLRRDGRLVGAPFSISFDPRGGTLDEDLQQKVVLTEVPYGPLPVPERKRYRFLGWSKSSLSDDFVTAETIFTEVTQTLYAVWERVPNPALIIYID